MESHLKHMPLSKWRCDVCGEWADASAHVAWQRSTNGLAHGFVVVHAGDCDSRDNLPSWLHVSDLLGPDGAARLTSFLSLGEVHRQQTQLGPRVRVADMDEFIHLFRRLQLPFYEEASAHFSDSEYWEDIDGANEFYPYLQDSLRLAATRPPPGS